MSCGEYNLSMADNCLTSEHNNSQDWMNDDPCCAISVLIIALEDEIRLLRSRMEKIFLEEQSFTADIVVEISSLLDLKLNEYMKARTENEQLC